MIMGQTELRLIRNFPPRREASLKWFAGPEATNRSPSPLLTHKGVAVIIPLGDIGTAVVRPLERSCFKRKDSKVFGNSSFVKGLKRTLATSYERSVRIAVSRKLQGSQLDAWKEDDAWDENLTCSWLTRMLSSSACACEMMHNRMRARVRTRVKSQEKTSRAKTG